VWPIDGPARPMVHPWDKAPCPRRLITAKAGEEARGVPPGTGAVMGVRVRRGGGWVTLENSMQINGLWPKTGQPPPTPPGGGWDRNEHSPHPTGGWRGEGDVPYAPGP